MNMTWRHRFASTLGMLILFLTVIHQPAEALCAELQPATVAAFDRYVKAAETRMDGEMRRPAQFLHIDGLPKARWLEALAVLKRGEIFMEQLKTEDQAGQEIKAPNGLIHHWEGAVFVPGTTLPQTLALVQDYDRHQTIYLPEVVRSKLVSRNGNDFKIFYRLRKKKVITVTLNTDYDIHYYPLDALHCFSRSYTTRIQEVDDADKPTERQKPAGKDSGFLWRLYSYWRFEQKDGGVYIECESISLTRDIPWLLVPLIKPFVTEIPKESLQMILGSTRRVLAEETAAGQGRIQDQ
jgi:hypothetical protein